MFSTILDNFPCLPSMLRPAEIGHPGEIIFTLMHDTCGTERHCHFHVLLYLKYEYFEIVINRWLIGR